MNPESEKRSLELVEVIFLLEPEHVAFLRAIMHLKATDTA